MPLWGCQVIVRSELIKTSESTRGHGFDILLMLWAKYKQIRPLLSAFIALLANSANCLPWAFSLQAAPQTNIFKIPFLPFLVRIFAWGHRWVNNSVLEYIWMLEANYLRRGIRSDAQLSCTETWLQKCSQSGKNGSEHPMLSICMAYNVTSCKKFEHSKDQNHWFYCKFGSR